MNAGEYVDIAGQPEVAGLRFRRFKGDSDYPVMSSIGQLSWKADHIDWFESEEELRSQFRSTAESDPLRDLLFAELHGEVIGFYKLSWSRKTPNETAYWITVHLLPDHRGIGIREFMFRAAEDAVRSLAKDHEAEQKTMWAWALDTPNDWRDLVLRSAYSPIWSVVEMVRPNLEDIPATSLPEDIEMRAVKPSDYRAVWEASKEAYRREPWFFESNWDDEHFEEWLRSSLFMPDLWQVAWDGDRIVGTVQNFINAEENRRFDRMRGHTERIFVHPPWRGKGVAKALVARSLAMFKDMGMEEVTLDAHAESSHHSVRVYQSMGYTVVKQFVFCKKPL